MSIAVSIVEDDPGVRSSLVKLINSSPGYRCVSQHSTRGKRAGGDSQAEAGRDVDGHQPAGHERGGMRPQAQAHAAADAGHHADGVPEHGQYFQGAGGGRHRLYAQADSAGGIAGGHSRSECRRLAHERPYRPQNRAIVPGNPRGTARVRDDAFLPARPRCWICWPRGFFTRRSPTR